MTNEASRLMAEALRVAKLDGSFSSTELGAKIGLNRPQAEAAARELSNAGVLVLGFDSSASFSPDFRKVRAKLDAKATAKGGAKSTGKGKKGSPEAPVAAAAGKRKVRSLA